jgi:hypothetical protein
MGFVQARERREIYAKHLGDLEVGKRIILREIGNDWNENM